jgi:hypothetical protein
MARKEPVVNPSTPKKTVSYRDLQPLEEGGPFNRKGIAFQDHVGGGKCLDMVLDPSLAEVWCEAEDDIVLVWIKQGEEWFEFVQVKSDELDQLWSINELCKTKAGRDGTPGKCIVEKSLAHDRGDGKCLFRIVTCREPNSELTILKLARDHSDRLDGTKGVDTVIAMLNKKVGGFRSENGNDVSFWVKMAIWESKATIQDIENENLVKLDRILHAENVYLAPDQKQELYSKLLQKVFNASMPARMIAQDTKRITKSAFRTWLLQQVADITRPASAGRSDILEGKLKDGGLGSDEIEAAKERRRDYRQVVLQPTYLDITDRQTIEAEVQALLIRLKAQLDAGEVADNGLQFHCRCLKEITALRDALTTKSKPSVGVLFGLMYDIMNRCQHRLVRASA